MDYELPEPQAPDPKRRFLCRHVFSEGRRCGSPALRGHHLCFYHHSSRQQPPIANGRTRESAVFQMPPIDDRAGVQLALYQVLARIAGAELDPKRAGLLLYGLQIASANLPRHPKAAPADLSQPAEPLVEHVTHHLYLGALAPVQELPEDPAKEALPEQQPPPTYPRRDLNDCHPEQSEGPASPTPTPQPAPPNHSHRSPLNHTQRSPLNHTQHRNVNDCHPEQSEGPASPTPRPTLPPTWPASFRATDRPPSSPTHLYPIPGMPTLGCRLADASP